MLAKQRHDALSSMAFLFKLQCIETHRVLPFFPDCYVRKHLTHLIDAPYHLRQEKNYSKCDCAFYLKHA